ncbi:MAG: hypothetical protein IKC65_08365 [Lentisphaeria bacterium]|nr:hypothetical protein [Lentisphaeria bacterium]
MDIRLISRIPTPPRDQRQNRIAPQYAADHAAWIWHPEEMSSEAQGAVFFKLSLELDRDITGTFSITADNRFELYLDGAYLAMGPDRSDVDHWAFSSFELALEKGRHELEVFCYFFSHASDSMPRAQLMYFPGFLFAAEEEELRPLFNTGLAPWVVRQVPGISFEREILIATGKEMTVDIASFYQTRPYVVPAVVTPPRVFNIYGGRAAGHRLYPSGLPEQTRERWKGAVKVRAVIPDAEIRQNKIFVTNSSEKCYDDIRQWSDLFDGKQSVEIPSNSKIAVLIDFEDYLCAFAHIKASGGPDTVIRTSWSEALSSGDGKGCRDQITDKSIDLLFDCTEYRHFDGQERLLPVIWWGAGRYFLLHIETKAHPARVTAGCFYETVYPLEKHASLSFDDDSLNGLQYFMERTLLACLHTTYMDCPFYEQLMYVGDTRLEMLTSLVLSRDSRPALRALKLFDFSRSCWNGLVAEHYPGRFPQLSATFTMLYPLLVRDFLMYRPFDEQDFLDLRCTVRNIILTVSRYLNQDALIENLPGWSFCDWVPAWNKGIPFPGDSTACSSLFSLHYLMALRAAMCLEEHLPEKSTLLPWYRSRFDETAAAVRKHFFDPVKQLFADDPEKRHFSMHAQCFAILSGLTDEEESRRCLENMFACPDIARPTVYFSHYLFETLKKCGWAEEIFQYSSIWKEMKARGAVSVWEKPEPTRSDCHGWGTHLLYHYYSTIAGIRPAAPGFKEVEIAPARGHLNAISGKMPHPEGLIVFDMKWEKDTFSACITLPENIRGRFVLNGRKLPLSPGENRLFL